MNKLDKIDKINKINQSMCKFNDLLTNTEKELGFNLLKIEQSLETHNDFVNFVEIMNIYEDYRWTNIKSEYNFIKKKINKEKKVTRQITKFFGSLTNYYTLLEIDNINIRIKDITTNIELIIYNFNKLQRLHDDVHNKRKYMIRNPNIVKIDCFDDSNKHILLKLYENYISIKLLNMKFKNLRNVRKNLIHEINSIQVK